VRRRGCGHRIHGRGAEHRHAEDPVAWSGETIAEATLAECKSKGFTTSAVVVDRAGQVL
jgi:hypothetical protein